MSKTSNPRRPDRYRLPSDIKLSEVMETLRIENDVVNKIVSYLADDMFFWWREFDGLPDVAQKMKDAEGRHRIRAKLSQVLKIARLHGTGLLVILTREASPEQPLDIGAIRPGDFANLLVVTKYNAMSYPETEVSLPGSLRMYEISLNQSPSMNVHPSRVMRFDGISPTEKGVPIGYPRKWGLSVLVPPILTILKAVSAKDPSGGLTGSLSALAKEADRISPMPLYEEPRYDLDPSDWARNDISAYHYCDPESFEGMERLMPAIVRNSTELFKLLNRIDSRDRLVTVSDLPVTRMRQFSPVVINDSASESERGYATHIASLQTRLLVAPLQLLDAVVARDSGLGEPPNYRFKPLVYVSELDDAQSAESLVDGVSAALDAGLIDRKEARRQLRTHPMFANLSAD